MKTKNCALCLSGIVGGMSGKNGKGKQVNYVACYNAYRDHIIDKNKADVFMHSWSVGCEHHLTKLYKPLLSEFEPQISFLGGKDEFIIRSRFYGMKRAVDLKKKYEMENNFKYKWVMVSRFDLLWFVDFDFMSLDREYFYASHFNDIGNKGIWKPNKGNRSEPGLKHEPRYNDMWFVGTSEFIDKFASLYDNIDHYWASNKKGAGFDPHGMCWEHVKFFAGDPDKLTKYKFYRWFDYELYRNKFP